MHVPIQYKGYFYLTIWPNENNPVNALKDREWKLEEVEQELRAQIELAMNDFYEKIQTVMVCGQCFDTFQGPN